MKYFTLIIVGFFIFSNISFSQSYKGNGNLIKNNFQISNVENIANFTSANLFITQSDSENMTVELDENLMQYFEYKGSKNDIDIRFNKSKVTPTKFNIYISISNLKKLENTGSGNVTTSNTLKANEFAFEHTGSGNSEIDISSKSLKTEITGSGNSKIISDAEICNIEHTGSGNTILINENKYAKIKFDQTGSGNNDLLLQCNSFEFSSMGSGNTKIKGFALNFKLECAGSGDVKGESFVCDNCNVIMNGSGNVLIGCSKMADIEILGSGDLTMKGDYKINKIIVNGSGKLIK